MINKENLFIDNDIFISYETYIIKNKILLQNPFKFSQTTSKHFRQWLEYNGFNEHEIKRIKKVVNFDFYMGKNIYDVLNNWLHINEYNNSTNYVDMINLVTNK